MRLNCRHEFFIDDALGPPQLEIETIKNGFTGYIGLFGMSISLG
jgi:hypothetical protein